MKCIRYRVYIKATGKFYLENFAWIDSTTDENEWAKARWSQKLFRVEIIK